MIVIKMLTHQEFDTICMDSQNFDGYNILFPSQAMYYGCCILFCVLHVFLLHFKFLRILECCIEV